MKVYTKTGDQGETGLFGGERVAKDHPRLEAYGSVDELNAVIGWLRVVDSAADVDQVLERIQHILFDLGAELASPDPDRLTTRSHPVTADDVSMLERAIDEWETELEALESFILPGGCEGAARAHVMRTVVRRAERQVVALSHDVTISGEIIQFLNRLSDFAFVLARTLNKRAGQPDVKWKQGKS